MIGKISVRQCLQASGYRGKGIGNPPGYRYDYNGGYDQQQDGQYHRKRCGQIYCIHKFVFGCIDKQRPVGSGYRGIAGIVTDTVQLHGGRTDLECGYFVKIGGIGSGRIQVIYIFSVNDILQVLVSDNVPLFIQNAGSSAVTQNKLAEYIV